MPKPEWIARQSGHPRGWAGALVARVMAYDTTAVNTLTLDQLAPAAGEEILEIGCGHGRTLQRLLARAPEVRVAGVDPSEVMNRHARNRNRAGVRAGRVRIDHGHAAALPYADERFHAAFGVHTLYFWSDVSAGLREIARVLRPGGRLLLVHRPLDDDFAASELPASVYTLQPVASLEKALRENGFTAVQSRVREDAKGSIAFASARKAGAQ